MAPTWEHEKPYRALVPHYDELTRAAYEVMGRRWRRFQHANAAFLQAERGTPEFYALGERAYRLGRRSTHAYFLWTKGHTSLVLRHERAAAAAAAAGA